MQGLAQGPQLCPTAPHCPLVTRGGVFKVARPDCVDIRDLALQFPGHVGKLLNLGRLWNRLRSMHIVSSRSVILGTPSPPVTPLEISAVTRGQCGMAWTWRLLNGWLWGNPPQGETTLTYWGSHSVTPVVPRMKATNFEVSWESPCAPWPPPASTCQGPRAFPPAWISRTRGPGPGNLWETDQQPVEKQGAPQGPSSVSSAVPVATSLAWSLHCYVRCCNCRSWAKGTRELSELFLQLLCKSKMTSK